MKVLNQEVLLAANWKGALFGDSLGKIRTELRLPEESNDEWLARMGKLRRAFYTDSKEESYEFMGKFVGFQNTENSNTHRLFHERIRIAFQDFSDESIALHIKAAFYPEYGEWSVKIPARE